jgi:hypothetical protein
LPILKSIANKKELTLTGKKELDTMVAYTLNDIIGMQMNII